VAYRDQEMARTEFSSSPPAGYRRKPLWVALCFAVGVGLGWWSLFIVGAIALLAASIAVAANQRSWHGARATLIALIVGYEAGLAVLIALYALLGVEPSGGWLYLVALIGAGLAIELPILWWRERKGDLV
jgi:hypothetical protein